MVGRRPARGDTESIGIPAAIGADGRRYGAGDIDAVAGRLPGPLRCGGGRCEAVVHAVRGHTRRGTQVRSSFHLNPFEQHSPTCGYRFDAERGTVHHVTRSTPDPDLHPDLEGASPSRAPYRVELRASSAVTAPWVGAPAAPVGPRTARLEVSHGVGGSGQPRVLQSARSIGQLSRRLARDVQARESFRVEAVDRDGVAWTLGWGQFYFDVSTLEGATAYERHLVLGRTYPVAVVGVVKEVRDDLSDEARVKRRVWLSTTTRRINDHWVNASVNTHVPSRLPYEVGQRVLGLGVWTAFPAVAPGVERVYGSMLCTDPRQAVVHRPLDHR